MHFTPFTAMARRRAGAAAVALSTLLAPAVSAAAPASAAATTYSRYAGASRYDTDAAILAQYPAGVPAVYVTTGTAFPDALGAAAAAGSTSPVALVDGASIPSGVLAQVKRLAPGKVVLVGGPSVVPDSVGATLGAYAAGGWTREAGASRWGTSAAIATATFAPGVPVAYVASGLNFPDALSASALGARTHAPVLIVPTTAVPAEIAGALRTLRPGKIVVLGGPSVVSAGVVSALSAYAPSVSRVYGADRVATNLAANATLPSVGAVVVASAGSFPDALAGGPLAARLGGTLVLAGSSLTSGQVGWLNKVRPGRVVVVGGTGVMSDKVGRDTVTAAGGGNPTATSTAPAPTGPVSTADPSANLDLSAPLQACYDAPTSSSCTAAALAALNAGRAREHLPAFTPPAGWSSLTPARQLYLLTKDERAVRHLAPLSGMVGAFDTSVASAASTRTDPLPVWSVSGAPVRSFAANWADTQGGPLLSMAFWMYADGPGTFNVDCTQAGQAGCWGHRHNVLTATTLASGEVLVADAAEHSWLDSTGQAFDFTDTLALARVYATGHTITYTYRG